MLNTTTSALILVMLTIGFSKQELPIGFTEEEWQNRHLIQSMGNRTDPPPTPIRNIAEFERMEGVLIRYPFGISTSIISEMAEDVIVYCLVSNGQQNSAYNSMNNSGVNMANVEFVLGNTDSYWTRDYGPWWVVDGDRNVSVVDHTYNRPRPNDNQAPSKMADHLNTPYFDSDIVTAGGNYMTDGLGIGASSDLIYDENDLTVNQVHNLMAEYYGIYTYHGIPDPNNTYIDHIDCWGKYLSMEKVLIRSVPSSHAQYDEIEETAEYFANSLTAYGDPWQVFRVYTPSNQPYTNSLILNNKVIVPIMNNSWDDEALDVYTEAMPGYEVLGFTGSWESTDALHCRAKGIPDLEMLQIFHHPLNDVNLPISDYQVNAVIDDLSDEGLIEDQLKVYWKNEAMAEFEAINLVSGTNEDEYTAFIPIQPVDTEIQYYIHAEDYSGRSENLPFAGYFSFFAVGGTPQQDGDANMDGLVNIVDVILVVNHVLNINPLEGTAFLLSDMNNDGILNILDIIGIVNVILDN